MRRFVGIIAFMCSLSILIFALPVTATDIYESSPSTAMAFIHNNTSAKYVTSADRNTVTGLYSFNLLVPMSDFGNIQSYRFATGCAFGRNGFDEYGKYQYTLSLAPSASNSITVNNPSQYVLSYCDTDSHGSPMVAERTVISHTPEISQDNGVYTFTFKGLTFSDLANAFLIFMDTPVANLTPFYNSTSASFEWYFMNIYFGLESDFDEESFNREVGKRLDDIHQSIDRGNQKLDSIDDSINEGNEKLDGIQNTLDNQLDNEIDRAESESNDTNSEAEQVLGDLPDFSESYNNILNNLTSVLYDMNLQTHIDLPDGNIGVLGQTFNIWGGETSVDLSEILNNKDVKLLITIGKAISVLGCMATSIYWAFRIKEWITANDEVMTPEIPFLPGGGKF